MATNPLPPSSINKENNISFDKTNPLTHRINSDLSAKDDDDDSI